ncbi:ROK family protein [Sanguibacter suaedae]|uniref:ROK family protein n=1 Tax=Sanguibacter suaedae TaxID=2795737 RepID=A0A934M629_9MICO|nr:ROK family protein [Sanguibacter suaedae]MBI9113787.1 ROK family protein [Sanguibacter suaedae]
MTHHLVLALDVGGTNTRGEVLDATLGEPLARAALPTPERDGEATLTTIEALCRELLGRLPDARRTQVAAVGLGVPGIVDTTRGTVRLAGNLGWTNMPVGDRLAARLGLPVHVHHDVTAAGLAEQALGAGAGVDDLLAVFIGTGIAAAIVAGGVSVRGGLHQAGELGHVPVDPDGLLCPCGQRGCLEMYSSARAIGRTYGAVTGNPAATSLDVVTALGHDPRADAVWSEALDALAHGLLGAITLLAPSRVVLGGGLSGAGAALVDPLRARLVARARVAAIPPIVTAELGQRAGVLGAGLATFRRIQGAGGAAAGGDPADENQVEVAEPAQVPAAVRGWR